MTGRTFQRMTTDKWPHGYSSEEADGKVCEVLKMENTVGLWAVFTVEAANPMKSICEDNRLTFQAAMKIGHAKVKAWKAREAK
jgi:hypothetical protein